MSFDCCTGDFSRIAYMSTRSDMFSSGKRVATSFESVVAFYAGFLAHHFQVRSSRRIYSATIVNASRMSETSLSDKVSNAKGGISPP